MSGKLKIIGGQWRSRIIQFDDAPGLRPTPARVRETLFNWLQKDVPGSVCLDLCAGSGALGFEAASRGAKQVVLVESNSATCQCLRRSAAQLQAESLKVCNETAENYLRVTHGITVDLVFIDPPFAGNLWQNLCEQLAKWPCLANEAKVYLELERKHKLTEIPSGWELIKETVAGDVRAQLYQVVERNEQG